MFDAIRKLPDRLQFHTCIDYLVVSLLEVEALIIISSSKICSPSLTFFAVVEDIFEALYINCNL